MSELPNDDDRQDAEGDRAAHVRVLPGDLVAQALGDPLRPAFHFTAPAGWLNDPNGVCSWSGRHHLFYQYNPEGAFHHRIRWGHAVSDDLVRWTDLPIALEPGAGPDRDGCWSGVLVDTGERPALVYSGRHGDRELPCVAWGDDDLLTWLPDAANPVVDRRPCDPDHPDAELTAFRDHCVWRQGDAWRMIVGSGVRGVGGCAFMYESDDLVHWRDLGPLVVGDADDRPADALDWTGTMWECVDLFHLGEGVLGAETGVDVLVFSAWDEGATLHTLCWIGHYDGQRFHRDRLQRLDFGRRHYYAPQSYRAPDGRRIVHGWMQEARSDDAMLDAGWCGAMAVPRELFLADDGTVAQRPVAEVALLRGQRNQLMRVPAAVNRRRELRVRGTQLDLELDGRLPVGAELRLGVLVSAGRGEETVVRVTRDGTSTATLSLDRSRSSLDSSLDASLLGGQIPLPGGRLELRVLVDRSSVEVFANGCALTGRVYPTGSGGQLSIDGQHAVVDRLDVWPMRGTEQVGRTLG